MNDMTQTAANNTPPDPAMMESPDVLKVKRPGQGVRRLNRKPLLIVGGVVSAAAIAIAYTVLERESENQATVQQASMEVAPVSTPAVAPISPGKAGPPEMPTDDMSADPNMPTDQDIPTDQVVPAIQQQPGGTPVDPAQRPAMSPEREARMRLIQRIREGKLAAWEAALGGEPGVQGFNRNPSAAAGGDPSDSMARLAQLAAANQAYAAGAGGAGGAAMGGGGGEDGQGAPVDPNQQDHKRAFLSGSPEADVYLKSTRQAALSRFEVKAGTIIPGVMISGVNSDLPGQVVGQVRQNVFDTASGDFLLIPAGARLIGTYDSTVTNGQKRVLIAWTRIVYPDGSSVSIGNMPGADKAGYAGFRDKVNNHYGRIFGSAMLLSGFAAGVQLSQPRSSGGEYSAREIASAELGRQMGQLGMEMARRNMDIQPTIKIRPGYKFNINVTKDMILPRWTGHPAKRR
jgi:type IV secretory pathway VirB10-like protein